MEAASKSWENKQRTLIVSSRGPTQRHRHLMHDIFSLMPHSKKEVLILKRQNWRRRTSRTRWLSYATCTVAWTFCSSRPGRKETCISGWDGRRLGPASSSAWRTSTRPMSWRWPVTVWRAPDPWFRSMLRLRRRRTWSWSKRRWCRPSMCPNTTPSRSLLSTISTSFRTRTDGCGSGITR